MKGHTASPFSRRSILGAAGAAGAGLALAACSTSGVRSDGGSAAATTSSTAADTGFTDADFAALKGAKLGVVGVNLQGPTVARGVQIMTDMAKKYDFSLEAVSSDFDLSKTNDTMRVWSDKKYDGIIIANTEAANISEGLDLSLIHI